MIPALLAGTKNYPDELNVIIAGLALGTPLGECTNANGTWVVPWGEECWEQAGDGTTYEDTFETTWCGGNLIVRVEIRWSSGNTRNIYVYLKNTATGSVVRFFRQEIPVDQPYDCMAFSQFVIPYDYQSGTCCDVSSATCKLTTPAKKK